MKHSIRLTLPDGTHAYLSHGGKTTFAPATARKYLAQWLAANPGGAARIEDQFRDPIPARVKAKPTVDMTWTPAGMFVAFMPQTPDGQEAWKELARQSDGTGKFLAHHAPAVIRQLRAAGYTVAKSRPVKVSASRILKTLGL